MTYRISLGTVQFGLSYGVANQIGQVTFREAKSIIEYVKFSGVSDIDTAISYGESESNLGEIGVEEFNVTTKLPLVPENISEYDVKNWVVDQVDRSLSRLNLKKLYALLIHNPSQLHGKIGTIIFDALSDLKNQGKIKKLGVSIYSPNELEALDKDFKIEIVQAPFNLLDTRLKTSGWLERLKSQNVEIHTRSCFLQGLLLLPPNKVPTKFKKWSNIIYEYHTWLSKERITPAHACLAFVLSNLSIDKVVVGVDSLVHIKEIISIAKYRENLVIPDFSCSDLDLIEPVRW